MESRNRTRRDCLRLGATALGVTLAGCSAPTKFGGGDGTDDDDDGLIDDHRLVDDWQFDPSDLAAEHGGGSSGAVQASASGGSAASAGDASIGFAAGGAKDIANFRDNVDEGYLPIPTDLSHEGLFYDYYFDTGSSGDCSSLFCPAYSTATTADPLSGESERYLTVGLNSGRSLSAFERKRLNLVVVLDISGSMSSPFDEYYYDRFGNRKQVDDYTRRPKMEVATESVAALTTHLREGDQFGMVVYNNESFVAKPMRAVEETDMEAIRGHIEELSAGGGTRLSAGVDDATDLLSEYTELDPETYETRMVVLTDAMPNLGETSEGGLVGAMQSNADRGIYTTFIGMGVDFNTRLVDALTAVRGANYYSVHSAKQFEQRLDEEFEYMVTPLVFDLSLELDAPGYDVEAVYGSTAAEDATDELVHVNTLFPAPRENERTRGGVVLVKLRQLAERDASDLSLTASWETRTGATKSQTTAISFPSEVSERFDNSGIRKAVLLTRYASLLRNWMVDERVSGTVTDDEATETVERPEHRLGQWERQSSPLTVSPPYPDRFERFADYFEAEMAALDDDSLETELDLLRRLLEYGDSQGRLQTPHVRR